MSPSSASDTLPGLLAATAAVLDEGRLAGLHLGGQLYASLRGEVVADAAFGEDRPGQAMRADRLMAWMSSSKPITAVAVARLWERGALELDDPIARHIPQFAQGGKEAITLRHALTHTGGFRMLDVGWPGSSWDDTLAKICAARREPRWEPGKRAGYHRASSWFVLGEIVQRLSDEPFAEHVRREIFEPLGMERSWIGMPAQAYADWAPHLATTWNTAAEGEPRALGLESEEHVVRASPAGGGRGPMRELGFFYEALLAGGQRGAARILTPQTVEALAARHRVGMHDRTFRSVMDWGLGLIPDSKQYGDEVPYAYGRRCSPRTYGHGGYRSSTAFADPEHGLVVALAFNGLPADADHEGRMRRTVEAIYEDLELVS